MVSNIKIIKEYRSDDGRWYLECTCDICSKDKELFPEPFTVRKDSFVTATTPPCGCGGNYRFNNRQLKLLVKRVCREKGYTLKSLTFSEKGKAYHKADLLCSKGHEFSIRVITLLDGGECDNSDIFLHFAESDVIFCDGRQKKDVLIEHGIKVSEVAFWIDDSPEAIVDKEDLHNLLWYLNS